MMHYSAQNMHTQIESRAVLSRVSFTVNLIVICLKPVPCTVRVLVCKHLIVIAYFIDSNTKRNQKHSPKTFTQCRTHCVYLMRCIVLPLNERERVSLSVMLYLVQFYVVCLFASRLKIVFKLRLFSLSILKRRDATLSRCRSILIDTCLGTLIRR